MVRSMDELQKEHCAQVEYELTCAEVDGFDDIRYTCYGIQAVGSDGEVLAVYHDVDTRRDFVQEIVDKCNKNQLSYLHLEDILLDSIC